LTHPDAFGAFA